MTLANVELNAKQEAFVASQVESGDYADANEVVRVGLTLLENRKKGYEQQRAELRAAIEAGFASGFAEGDVFARVRERAGCRPGNRFDAPSDTAGLQKAILTSSLGTQSQRGVSSKASATSPSLRNCANY